MGPKTGREKPRYQGGLRCLGACEGYATNQSETSRKPPIFRIRGLEKGPPKTEIPVRLAVFWEACVGYATNQSEVQFGRQKGPPKGPPKGPQKPRYQGANAMFVDPQHERLGVWDPKNWSMRRTNGKAVARQSRGSRKAIKHNSQTSDKPPISGSGAPLKAKPYNGKP